MSVQFFKQPRLVLNRARNSDGSSVQDMARRSIFEDLMNYFRSGYLEENILVDSLRNLFPDANPHKINQTLPLIRKLNYASNPEGLIDIVWERLYE